MIRHRRDIDAAVAGAGRGRAITAEDREAVLADMRAGPLPPIIEAEAATGAAADTDENLDEAEWRGRQAAPAASRGRGKKSAEAAVPAAAQRMLDELRAQGFGLGAHRRPPPAPLNRGGHDDEDLAEAARQIREAGGNRAAAAALERELHRREFADEFADLLVEAAVEADVKPAGRRGAKRVRGRTACIGTTGLPTLCLSFLARVAGRKGAGRGRGGRGRRATEGQETHRGQSSQASAAASGGGGGSRSISGLVAAAGAAGSRRPARSAAGEGPCGAQLPPRRS